MEKAKACGSNPPLGEGIAPSASAAGNGIRSSARQVVCPSGNAAADRCNAGPIQQFARTASVPRRIDFDRYGQRTEAARVDRPIGQRHRSASVLWQWAHIF